MDVLEAVYRQQIDELKDEVQKLRKEVKSLSIECINWQQIASSDPGNLTSEQSLTDLHSENVKLQNIIDNMNVGVGIADNQGNTLSLNKAALDLHGFKSEEEMFSRFSKYTEEFELQYPDGKIMPLEEWPSSRALRGEYVKDYEVKLIRHKTGGYRFINYSAVPIYDATGNLILLLFNMTDTTKVHKINEALRESEQRYWHLFNNKTIGIAHYEVITNEEGTPVDYTILRVNDAYTEITGINKENIEGKRAAEIFPWLKSISYDYIKNYGKIALEGGELTLEQYVRPLDQWFSIYVYSPKKGEFTTIFTDITERKRIEEELKANEAIMESFFEASPGLLTLFDQNLRFIRADKLIPSYFNLNRKSILGRSVWELNRPLAEKFLAPVLKKILEKKEPILNMSVEEPFSTPNETPGYWSISFFPVTLPGGETGLGCIGANVTALKKAEANLAYERELFEGIFNNIPVMITIYDPNIQNFRFNKEIKNVLGWTEEDAAHGDFMEKVYPDPEYRKKVIEYMKSLERGWKEYTLKSKDGKDIDSSWANIMLTSGTQIGIGIDIRERKKAEEELRARATEIEAIISCIPDGILVYDNNGAIIKSNAAADSFLGYPKSEEGERISERVNKHYKIWTEDERLLKAEEMPAHKAAVLGITSTNQILRLDGHEQSRWFIFNAAPLIIEGKHAGAVLSMLDISQRKQTEQLLKESEERFRLLADNISQMAWISNTEGNLLWFNKRWFDYTGVSLEEMQDGGRNKVYHPDYIQPVLESFQKSLREVSPWEYIFPMQSKEGEYRWFLSRALPIRDENENITLWFGTNTDVTEQRKAEEALRESEQRLQAIFNNAAIGIVEVDYEDRFVYVNERICQILGYSREELLNKTVHDLTAPEDQLYTEMMNKRLHQGEFDILNYEKRYIKKDCTHIWVHVSVSAIRNKDRAKTHSIGTIEDISDRKQIEQKLKDSEEKFRSLFENVTEGIALHDIIYKDKEPVNYRITHVNPAYKCYCGIDEKMAVGSLATDLYNTQEPPYFEKYLQVAETRQPMRFETFFPTMNKHFIINVVSPKKGQFATVFEDITEQKRIEKEIKQKNEELTRFIYTVSHDLKSPLVTIKSFASYLKSDIEDNDTETVNRDIGYIKNAADKMGKLLDELLELSRIGRKEEAKVEVPLENIANIAIDLLAGRIKEGNITIEFVGPKVMLYGHSQRLIQLYQNLIDNAAKFMGNQPNPKIQIGTLYEPDKNSITLFVSDNGMGIDPRYHHKIFGLFEKLDNNSEGTGIGLALIKRIVEVHGGAIWFKSEGSGEGTTFYFTLEKTHIIKK
jgi:PAS domain S-box-containing protein